MGPPSIFDSWPLVESRLRAADRMALLLDFDGTRVPFIDNPEEVRLGAPLRQLLRRLAHHTGITVHIISGRRWADLRKRIGVPGVRLMGLHGWEQRGAKLPAEQKELLLKAKQWLEDWLPASAGIHLEDKGGVLAIHYRGAEASEVRIARQVMQIARDQFKPGLRLLKGKKIWELLPAAIPGKGPITRYLLKAMPAGTLPIFIGDDTSDEAAFAALPHGLAVHVGNQAKTKTHFTVRNPDEVREFLERLETVVASRKRTHHVDS
jgi:trehalose-phosphatase